MIRQLLSNEWQQSGFKDVTEQNSIHDAIKDTNLCGTMSADPSPNMNFDWMLRFRLSFRWLVNLPVTSARVLFKGNSIRRRRSRCRKCCHFRGHAEHTRVVSPCLVLVWADNTRYAVMSNQACYAFFSRWPSIQKFHISLASSGFGRLSFHHFFRICWFMKACASLLESFAGLPERGRFVTEPVIRSFLMIRVTLEKLTTKPSFFRDLNIPTGGRPCLSRSSIRVLV